jgi:hypothetical protein
MKDIGCSLSNMLCPFSWEFKAAKYIKLLHISYISRWAKIGIMKLKVPIGLPSAKFHFQLKMHKIL